MADDSTITTEQYWSDDNTTEAQPEPDKPAIVRLDPPTKLDLPADASQAPPTLDPYFRRKDGSPVTGEHAKTKTASKPAPKPAAAAPDEPEDIDASDDDDETEEPARIGDAWLEVQREKREAERLRESVEAERERIAAAEREAAEVRAKYEAEQEAMHTDLHSYLKRNGLSFFELVKADLERQDRETDPLYIARAEAEAAQREAAELQAEIEAEREREQAAAYGQARASEAQALQAILADVAEDCPAITAYGLPEIIAEVQAHREQHYAETGEALDYASLFAAAERELRARAERYSTIEAEPEQAEDDEPEPAPAPRKRITTITNRTAAARHSGPPKYADSGERARTIAHRTLRWRDEHGNLH